MDELISKNALYEQAQKLEDEAFKKLKEVKGDVTNTLIWNAILCERTAFKHDIADAVAIKKLDT